MSEGLPLVELRADADLLSDPTRVNVEIHTYSHAPQKEGPPRRFYAGRVEDRLVAEMLGLVKGVLADGIVNDAEAVALRQWLTAHADVTTGFPGSLLADRLRRIFEDGAVDEEERADLQETLRLLVGETPMYDSELNRATRLPLDDPPPTVLFDGREFVFTGKFAYGRRSLCSRAVTALGGRCSDRLGKETDYLVVGAFGSDAWVQSTYGTKILTAMDMRAAGRRVSIIGEEHWLYSLESC